MPDLIAYLESNGFYPRREDIEAILRRMDHDANRQINYDEFCELTCAPEPPRREPPPREEATPAQAENEELKNESNVQEFNDRQSESEELRQANEQPLRSPDEGSPGQDERARTVEEHMRKRGKGSAKKNDNLTAEEK